ncbi:tetracenomycin C synthesis protein homolog [Rivularia sp. IAM M-261]|nr:tetracenomycin C synthesis protein homolog [Calothrix sp. PCC 7716]GJD21273.1 tetracenomycin C synthesis protein homolog [Rivularia sp. IAM M-261]
MEYLTIMNKQTVNLGIVQETLLIPLWSRAVEASQPEPILYDAKAKEIVSQLDYDFDKFKAAKSTQVMMCIRGKAIDELTQHFIQQNPQATIVEIGAGLDTRFERLDNGQLYWFDLDLPDAIAVRKHFFEESRRRHFISASVLEPEWINQVKQNCPNSPKLFIAEGVLLYFTEEQVKTLLKILAENFPGSYLVFDAASPFIIKNRRSYEAVKHTSAKFQWGIKNIKDIEAWNSRYKITDSRYIWHFPEFRKRFSFNARLLMAILPPLTRSYAVHLASICTNAD